ncbi:MAG: hypothetical protein ACYTG0_42945 [Planctomycetota bacterium]|jgi:hypothetical protein
MARAARQTKDVHELHDFCTLLGELGTPCRNTCEVSEEKSTVRLSKLTGPSPLQSEAL